MTACVDTGDHDCCIEQTCHVKPHWNAVNDAVREALAGVTLASLAAAPAPAPAHVPTAIAGRSPNGMRVDA